MRVAHVMAGAAQGGAELFYERLVMACAAAGDEVLPVIRAEPGRAARLAALAPVQLPFGGLLDLRTGPRLRMALRRFGPAVVVAWMGRAARFAPSGPWVLIGRLGGYYDLGRFQRCGHLVANTAGLVRWITRQGWPAARVHHLPNFVPDLAGVDPAALGVTRPWVLAMGRLHRNKAFDVLIRAMRRLPGVQLVLAGEGPERPALEALARAEGVADQIHMLGWRADGGALLAACDALAVPSRLEPLGNVVVEGWSAGRPVVAADAAGPRELIQPGEDGLLVPREDAEALATALGTVLGAPLLARRLGEAGRARWAAEFAEAPVVARWRTGLARMAA
jgi:glycosyltransferase involved in cell wall biosynthesis